MSRLKLLGVTTAIAAAAWIVACGSDEPERNPSFMVGDAGAPAAGQPGLEDGGQTGKPSQPGAAGQDNVGGARTNGGSASSAGSPPETTAGAGGADSAQPPYDCVLNPRTHLEIINACTDALRIEKHPMLPTLPP